MLTRRDFIRAAALAPWLSPHAAAQGRGVVVNDIHSQLTATRVHRIVPPLRSTPRATLSRPPATSTGPCA
jgi:hypothetical protein